MAISELTVRVLILFLPGIICSLVVDSLTVHTQRSGVERVLRAFVLGMGSYLLYFVCRPVLHGLALKCDLMLFERPMFLEALTDPQARLDFGEILAVCLLGFVLGGALAAGVNHKVLNRLARTLRVTNQFADADVWSFTFNSPNIDWVVVRDVENDLMFYGWVHAFSDVQTPCELLLRDVTVYRNTDGTELYTVGALYVSRDRTKLVVELPTVAEYHDIIGQASSLQVQDEQDEDGEDHGGKGEEGRREPRPSE